MGAIVWNMIAVRWLTQGPEGMLDHITMWSAAWWAALIGKSSVFIAAMCGSVTGVAFMKPLNWRGRVLNFMIGLAAAMYVGPAIAEWWKVDPMSRAAPAIAYGVGVIALSAIPYLIKWSGDGGPLRMFLKGPTA